MKNREKDEEREILVLDDGRWNEFIRKAVAAYEPVRGNTEIATPEEEEEAIEEAVRELEEESE